MLNNKEIAAKFDLLAKLMELHDENQFKIRSYANAYLSLRKLEGDLSKMGNESMAEIPGVGTAIADKIRELLTTGEMKTLKKYQDITPSGIQEMLGVKGLGPKKVKQIWQEMEIYSIGELLYACNENSLVTFKGFGEKLQEEIKSRIEYFVDAKGKYLYAHVISQAEELLTKLQFDFPDQLFSLCGDIRRMMPELVGIDIISTVSSQQVLASNPLILCKEDTSHAEYNGIPLFIHSCQSSDFYSELFRFSGSDVFIDAVKPVDHLYSSEEEIFETAGYHYIPAEYREYPGTLKKYLIGCTPPNLIEVNDIKGIIHNHSTYSDGLHLLEDMANYVKAKGYDYFVISDHSKTAGYANGLSEERVGMQIREIDELNKKYNNTFKIFKSIESDILIDGSLDYDDAVLKKFDLVIASVHSVLNMDEARATARLIKAVENPFTRILGHPSSRLLLARQGYPLDYRKLIDACAANGVVIELNANPQRLDLDWTWIPYAMEKEVMISINPDAHSKESIHYIKFGTAVARKGGLTKQMCLNTKNLGEFEAWLRR